MPPSEKSPTALSENEVVLLASAAMLFSGLSSMIIIAAVPCGSAVYNVLGIVWGIAVFMFFPLARQWVLNRRGFRQVTGKNHDFW
ncbi:MAG: hypothetical protein Q8M07_24230 [Prosthecobacter sp.]|nr:hypothetical protein [Prosthecobacter sp.]